MFDRESYWKIIVWLVGITNPLWQSLFPEKYGTKPSVSDIKPFRYHHVFGGSIRHQWSSFKHVVFHWVWYGNCMIPSIEHLNKYIHVGICFVYCECGCLTWQTTCMPWLWLERIGENLEHTTTFRGDIGWFGLLVDLWLSDTAAFLDILAASSFSVTHRAAWQWSSGHKSHDSMEDVWIYGWSIFIPFEVRIGAAPTYALNYKAILFCWFPAVAFT